MNRSGVAVALACLVLTPSLTVADPPPDPPAGRTDALGDALPADAGLRLGSTRLRHPERVEAVAFSADGKLLASADSWALVRVWEAQTGKMRLELPRETGTAVAFSPDGKLLATGGTRMRVRLWDAASGKEIRTFRFPENRVAEQVEPGRCLAFSPDGRSLLCGDDVRKSVTLFEVESGRVLRRFKGLTHPAHAVAFSPDGKSVAAGDSVNFAGGESTILIWEATSGEQRCKILDAKQGWVHGVAFSPDGKTLASATPYHGCLWDATTGNRLVEFDRGVSNAVAFDAAGKRLITGGDVCVIDPATRQIVRRMGQGANFANVAALSPDGKTIASNGVYDERVRLWEADTGKEKLAVGHLDEIRSVAFSPDGKMIATACGGDGTVRLWDATRGTERHVLRLKSKLGHFSRGRPVALSFSADGGTLTAAGQFWDIATGRETEPPAEARGAQTVFSPEGRVTAAIEWGSDRYPVVALRDATGRLLRRLAPPDEKKRRGPQRGLAFSPDGRLLATGYGPAGPGAGGDRSPSETIAVWDVATGNVVRLLRPGLDVPALIVFSPNGDLLATSGERQYPPELWDPATGKEVRKLARSEDNKSHVDELNPVAFSPDGGLLATGGKDNVIVLLETMTGGVVRVLRGHQRPVRSVAFAPDGRTLVSGSADTTALVWPVVPAGGAGKWDAGKVGALWKTLEGEPAAAYPALWTLAAAPEQAVPFLKERLRPDAAVDERQLTQWIADLGDAKFAVREEATERLRNLGRRAESVLRKALEGQEDAERRRRLEDLLALLDAKTPDPALVRDLRAIRALEQMSAPTAEAFLEELARGPDAGPRTRAARAALLRLEGRRSQSRPEPVPAPRPAPQGREPSRLYSQDGEVHAVAFTPDGSLGLSAGLDGKVRRWDVAARKELPALTGHEGGTFALAVAPDGKRLASAGADGRVRLWNPGTGEEVASLNGHKGAVFAVAFSPDGKLLASGGADGTARLWDVEKREERHTIRAGKERVTTLAFAADGATLMTGCVFDSRSTFNGKIFPRYMTEPVRTWKVTDGTELRKWDRRGSTLVPGAGGKRLLVIEMRTSTVLNSDKEGPFNLTRGVVSMLDAVTEKPRLVVEDHGGAAAIAPDGRLLATARGSDLHVGDGVRYDRVPAGADDLRLWEVLSGQEVLRFAGDDPPTVLAFTPDGRHVLFGTRTGAVCLVETAPPDIRRGRPDRKALEALWKDLGSPDAAVAYRAAVVLNAAREDAPAFLAERLAPASAEDAELRRLIAELDAARYVVRRAAFAELARRGAEAEPALRAARRQAESPSVKQRLAELLAAPGIKAFPDPLRRLRAAAVLERIGTPEAKRMLGTVPPIPEPSNP